jgi:hypothetical protein
MRGPLSVQQHTWATVRAAAPAVRTQDAGRDVNADGAGAASHAGEFKVLPSAQIW